MGTTSTKIYKEIRLPEKYIDWSYDNDKER